LADRPSFGGFMAKRSKVSVTPYCDTIPNILLGYGWLIPRFVETSSPSTEWVFPCHLSYQIVLELFLLL